MPFQLISTEGDRTFDLKGEPPLVVGRALNSDLPVFDPTISRRHAEVWWDASGVRVRDLASSNGTFLNGAPVTAIVNVAPGDLITFGKVGFRLREVAGVERPPGSVRTPSVTPAAQRMGATIVRQLPPQEPRASGNGAQAGLPAGLAGVLRGAETASAPSLPASVPAGDATSRERLRLLLEVSKALSRAVEVDELMDKVVGFCFEIFDVDGVSIELMDERTELVPRVARDRRGTEAGRRVPRSIARTAVEERAGILSDNAGEDLRFGGHSVVMQRVRSTMCAPLVGSVGNVLGILYVDNITATHRFGEEDLDFLIAFAGIVGAAVENSQFAERIRREALVRANFERYFSPNLAARIAHSPDAVRLAGDKRQVAVLFSDIRGFTALSETMTPDDIARLLTEYFTEMVECVFRHGGTLDKFIGDAVMAQWGAPLGAPDDADRAMQSALDMMRALEQLNARWAAEGRPTLSIGIGLNVGEAFAGNIGSERRLEYTVIGDTVNTASRLCSAADAGEILLSDEMRRALTAPPPLAERPPMELKGKRESVRVYRVAV